MTDAEQQAAADATQIDVTPAFVVAAPVMMVVLALVGLLTILGLHWAWRRSDRRWRGNAQPAPATDVWRESARRATETDAPAPPVRPSIPPDPNALPFDLDADDEPDFDAGRDWSPDDDDEEDEDEDAEPWR
ncbi:MAG: hypothetical protein AAF823_08870 [Planctomycetota bacterium]